MRYLLSSVLTALIFFTACENWGEVNSLQTIHMSEMTRMAASNQYVSWLNSGDVNVRRAATRSLGILQDSSKALLLFNRNTDNDLEVRANSAFALGQLFSPDVESYILDFLKHETDKDVRLLLIDALGKSGTKKSFLKLQDFLEGTDPEYLKAVTVAHSNLARRGYFPSSFSVQLLSHHMSNNMDPEIVWRCANALAATGKLSSFGDLHKIMTHPDPKVRFASLRGMNQIATRIIETDKFTEYRKNNPDDANLRGLWRTYNSARFHRSVVGMLQDSIPYVRIAAIDLLSDMGNEPFQGEILKLVDDPNPNVQVRAIQAMEKFSNAKWYTRREMRKIYRDSSDWRIRGEALRILALVQPAEALERVKTEWLEQPWPQITYAIQTLQNIETFDLNKPLKEAEEATRLLMQLADSKNIAQSTLALEVLVNRQNRPRIDYFIGKLSEGDMAITTVVAKLLSVTRDAQGAKPLMDAYSNFQAPRDLEAIEAILFALGKIGNRNAVEFLESQLSNPYPLIRETAEASLRELGINKEYNVPIQQENQTLKWDFSPVSSDSSYEVTFYTSAGDFVIELFADKAPINVANFVSLVQDGFYKGIAFHRVVPGYVTQAGDPRGDGWGGPGYAVPCEYNRSFFDRGVVGIAHAGKDTGSSQFFVTQTPQPHLNGQYTAIGKVVKGMNVIDRILQMDKILNTDLAISSK